MWLSGRIRQLAINLNHPGCTGDIRSLIMKRFEEVVLHQGAHLYLVMPKMKPDRKARKFFEGSRSPISEGPISSNLAMKGMISIANDKKPPPRQFRSLADVSTWIQKNGSS